jgi:hypothetical protein
MKGDIMSLKCTSISTLMFAASRLHRAAVLCAAVVCTGACAQGAAPSIPNGMTREEYEFARNVMARDTTWRLAIADDSRSQHAIRELRRADSSYQPYFCRGSVSKPAASYSFVLARADTFRVIYVRLEVGREAIVDEVAQMAWLDDGSIMCLEDGIDIAPFNSDEVVSFRWNEEQRKLELVREEPTELDDPP